MDQTNKPNPNIPDKRDKGLSNDKRYFKAVSNYMANVLGVDRNEIYKMLAEKIESRNVDHMVLEAVEKYFGTGHNAAPPATDFVKRKVAECVEKHVQEQFRKGAGSWLDGLVQQKLEEIAASGRTVALETARHPAVGNQGRMRRPGLELTAAGAWISLTLLNAMVAQWLEQNVQGKHCPFETQLRYATSFGNHEVRVQVKNLNNGDMPAFQPLMPEGKSLTLWSGQTTLTDFEIKKIVAASLGWPEIARIVAGTDGVAVFPPAL